MLSTTRIVCLVPYVLLAALASGSPASAEEFAVDCDVQANDSAAIQALIDNADDGDVITVSGTCELDGGLYVESQGGPPIGASLLIDGKSRLTLQGEAVDDDLDGSINEDPLDGVDNDLDGWIDEDDYDAYLIGPGGDDCDHPEAPIDCDYSTNPPERFYNRGVQVTSGRLNTIRNFGFSNHWQAVQIASAVFTQGNLCAGVVYTSGVKNTTVEQNLFDGNSRDILGWGESEGTSIIDNLFVNEPRRPLLFAGGDLSCVVKEETPIFEEVALGTPRFLTIRGNTIVDTSGPFAILTWGTEHVTIQGNTVGSTNFAGIYSVADRKLRVRDNVVSGAFIGLLGEEPSNDVHFAGNDITAECTGILLDFEATDFLMINNVFDDAIAAPPEACPPWAPLVDFFFDDTTSANKVITPSSTTVIDLGENTVIFRGPGE